MRTTLAIIDAAVAAHGPPAVAFSGGSDSMVLLDIMCTRTQHPVTAIFADSQNEYPETRSFVEEVCGRYKIPLLVASAPITPAEQWAKTGWPMLGKYAARIWSRKNKGRGFRLDVSSCCRALKIAPARKLMREQGFRLQVTGQRGAADDALRGLRALKDGAVKYVKSDKITVANPLLGWTDTMIRRYTRQRNLSVHPARSRGAITIGCMYCGGGAQYTNSGFRVLRHTQPDAWRHLMVTLRAGFIVLAIKYRETLDTVQSAVDRMGGLARLADEKPWVFDFLTKTPIPGYDK